MGFSNEWEVAYQKNKYLSVWPWSHLVSLAHRYGNLHRGMRVLELGCGAGANIPFFVKEGVDYYGIEGSSTMVAQLNETFKGVKVKITQGDFTKDLSGVYEGATFDLIIDRGSLMHNETVAIKRTIEFIKKALRPKGVMIGTDWCSTKYDVLKKEVFKKVDDFTCVFSTGELAGLGNVHFSDENHIHELFADFSFVYLEEKQWTLFIPEKKIDVRWDFVVSKGDF